MSEDSEVPSIQVVVFDDGKDGKNATGGGASIGGILINNNNNDASSSGEASAGGGGGSGGVGVGSGNSCASGVGVGSWRESTSIHLSAVRKLSPLISRGSSVAWESSCQNLVVGETCEGTCSNDAQRKINLKCVKLRDGNKNNLEIDTADGQRVSCFDDCPIPEKYDNIAELVGEVIRLGGTAAQGGHSRIINSPSCHLSRYEEDISGVKKKNDVNLMEVGRKNGKIIKGPYVLHLGICHGYCTVGDRIVASSKKMQLLCKDGFLWDQERSDSSSSGSSGSGDSDGSGGNMKNIGSGISPTQAQGSDDIDEGENDAEFGYVSTFILIFLIVFIVVCGAGFFLRKRLQQQNASTRIQREMESENTRMLDRISRGRAKRVGARARVLPNSNIYLKYKKTLYKI